MYHSFGLAGASTIPVVEIIEGLPAIIVLASDLDNFQIAKIHLPVSE